MGLVIILCVCSNEMVPNTTRRLRKHSSKQRRAHKTEPGPLEQPSASAAAAAAAAPVAHPEPEATSKGHLGCPDRIYLLASVIFQNIHPEKPASQRFVNYGDKRRLPLPEVKSEERPAAYELAFNTLKCKCKLNDWRNVLIYSLFAWSLCWQSRTIINNVRIIVGVYTAQNHEWEHRRHTDVDLLYWRRGVF